MKNIITLLIVLLVVINLNAGEIAFGEIKNVSQYNKLQELKIKANNFLKNQPQPAEMFGFKYYPTSDIVMFWGQKQILMNIDIIVTAYNSGKIDLIGIRKYNRKGYIIDADFLAIDARITELYNIEVGTSTY